jgi:hypothetical protein
MADMLVIGGLYNISLELEDTELVNRPAEDVFSWTSLPVLATAIIVNLTAAVLLRRKEDTAVNRIIIWDCLINIVTMFMLTVFGPTPWFKGHNGYLCIVPLVINNTLTVWNRLVPIAIVVFRYLMVCSTTAVQCSAPMHCNALQCIAM